MTQHQAPEVTSELRECPNELCDYSRPHLNETDADLNATHTWVSCENCGACGPRIENPSQYFGRTEHWDEVKAEAITAWNTRATQPLSLTVDPVLAFEEYWGASKYRTRNMIGYSDKKCLAWEAYSAALQSLSLPVDIDRSGLAQEVDDISYAGVGP